LSVDYPRGWVRITGVTEQLSLVRWIPRVAVFILVILRCYAFWVTPHFPSQDGPSHLYNALVAAQYDATPIYREYYELHRPAAGHLLSHWLLIGLLRLSTPPVAEKILLSLYAALMPISFWIFLKVLSPDAEVFTVVTFLFLPSFYLYAGFWNFCF